MKCNNCNQESFKYIGKETKYSCGFDESCSWEVEQYKCLNCEGILEKSINRSESSINDYDYKSSDECTYFYQ